jgi:hypothetical protein
MVPVCLRISLLPVCPCTCAPVLRLPVCPSGRPLLTIGHLSVFTLPVCLLSVCLFAYSTYFRLLLVQLLPVCCLTSRLLLVCFLPVFPFAYLALLLSTRLPTNLMPVLIFCLHAPLLPVSRLLLCLSANPRHGRLPVCSVAFSFSKLLAYTDAAFVFAKHCTNS